MLDLEPSRAPVPARRIPQDTAPVEPADPSGLLPDRLVLIVGVWIEPGSDPGHIAHLDPVATLLKAIRRDFPATPLRLLVPPRVAGAAWLRQLTREPGVTSSVTTEAEPDAADEVAVLARRSHLLVCLAPGAEQSGMTRNLILGKRLGRLAPADQDTAGEPVPCGPVEFWDLSRGGSARRRHLRPLGPEAGEFGRFARRVRGYNVRMRRLASRPEPEITRIRERLVGASPAVRFTPLQATAVDRHAGNAAVAAWFGPRSRIVTWVAVFSAGAAGIWMAVSPDSLSPILGFPPLVLAAWLLHRFWHRRALHHRVLADAMEIHFIRSVAGLHSVQPVDAPGVGGRLPPWASLVLRSWIDGLAESEAVRAPDGLRIGWIRDTWIRSRGEEAGRTGAALERQGLRWRSLSRMFWGFAVGLAGFWWFEALVESPAAGLPGAIGAVLAAFLGTFAGRVATSLRLESERYRQEARRFRRAAAELARVGVDASLPAAVRQVESLLEDAWAEAIDRLSGGRLHRVAACISRGEEGR